MRLRTLLLTLGAIALVGPALVAEGAAAQTLDFDPPGAPAVGNFSGVTLNGSPQLSSLTIAPFTIKDDTGSGAGWNVTLTIPDLVNGGSTILASTITMAAPVVTAVFPASMTGVAGHATTGALASGEKIVTASAGNGAGSYLVSPQPVKLQVPPNAKAGTYASAASLAVISGP